MPKSCSHLNQLKLNRLLMLYVFIRAVTICQKHIAICSSHIAIIPQYMPGHVAQLVTCLATDACLTADPGVGVRSPSGPILSWRMIMK